MSGGFPGGGGQTSRAASYRTPLKRARNIGSGKAGTHHFWVQRVTAVILIPVGVWFVLTLLSLVGTDLETARSIIARPWNAILFSIFLDTSKIEAGSEVAFSIDLAVSNAGYEVDGALFLKTHIPGEYLFRNTLVLFAKRNDAQEWKLRYVWADDRWATGTKSEADLIRLGGGAVGIEQDASSVFSIPLESAKGFKANLSISMSVWK